MARWVRLGMVQFVPERWNVEGNFRRLLSILGATPPGTLDLVVTPECILDGYTAALAPNDRTGWNERERWLRECALERSGQVLGDIGGEARRLGSYIVVGYTEHLGDGRAANAASVFDREGELVATYHKTHLQNHDLQFERGKSWTVIEADFGRFGVMICADRRWPEAVRCQRLLGAEMLANPTYGMHKDLNLAMMRTRAFENNFFIAFTHPRQSLVTGPGGEVEVDVRDRNDTLVLHRLDLDRINLSHIRDRRTDLYRGCLQD